MESPETKTARSAADPIQKTKKFRKSADKRKYRRKTDIKEKRHKQKTRKEFPR